MTGSNTEFNTAAGEKNWLPHFNFCRKGQGCTRAYTKQGRTSLSTKQAVLDTSHEAEGKIMDVGNVAVNNELVEMLHRDHISKIGSKDLV